MDRIKQTFQRLAEKNEKALVGFVTAGDPTLVASKKILSAMCRSGIDILELGVPFSDPTADGPVIQRSSERAVKNGICLSTVLDMTAELRKETDTPIILFSYYNPIYAYGAESFYRAALAAGADGVLVCGCHPGDCHFVNGNLRARERFSVLGRLLTSLGVEAERVRLEWVSAQESQRYADLAVEMTEQIRALGPLRWPEVPGPLAGQWEVGHG